MLKLLRKRLLPLLFLPLAGCAGTAAADRTASAEARPAMWKVADADTTLYLFGTIHLLPEGQTWRTPAMERALASADELVLEIGEAGDVAAAAGAMMKLGLSPGLPPIAERVPADKRPALRKAIAESGVPEAALDRMETWAAGLTLLAVTFQRLGLDPQLGVETQISGDFRESGKPVRGLETVEEQFGLFDRLPEEAQRAFLVGTLDDGADARAQFQEMLAAWARGDVAGIERSFNDEASLSPELREALLARRNARWATWLDDRMERPGTVFVAVGAGHLAGPESVQVMLRKHGHKAKRVQ